MDNLNPCPFCGGEAILWSTITALNTVSKVECTRCHAATSCEKDDEKAIILWNDRVENESYILDYVKSSYSALMELKSRIKELEQFVKKEDEDG